MQHAEQSSLNSVNRVTDMQQHEGKLGATIDLFSLRKLVP